jgi:hypothetical protein
VKTGRLSFVVVSAFVVSSSLNGGNAGGEQHPQAFTRFSLVIEFYGDFATSIPRCSRRMGVVSPKFRLFREKGTFSTPTPVSVTFD